MLIENQLQIKKYLNYLKSGDYFALIFSISAVVILLLLDFNSQIKPELVEVRSGTSTWLYPLKSNITFQPLDEEGTCLIEIRDNRVKVLSSSCPLNICITMGEIYKLSQWIACLPHKVFISITGKEGDNAPDDNALDGFVY